jgi:hypothetical protein
MHNARRRALLWSTLVLSLGCVDAVAPRAPAGDLELFVPPLLPPETAIRMNAEHSLDTAAHRPQRMLVQSEEDPSFSQPTSLTVRADAGFNGTTAYGQSLLNYWANTARSTVNLGIRYGNTNVGSTSATESASFTLPAARSLVASATMSVSACGNTANVGAAGIVWNETLSLSLSPVVFGRLESTANNAVSQAACEAQQPPDGGGGGSGGAVGGGDGGGGGNPAQWYICYYTLYYVGGTYVGFVFWGCAPL